MDAGAPEGRTGFYAGSVAPIRILATLKILLLEAYIRGSKAQNHEAYLINTLSGFAPELTKEISL